MFLRTVKNKSSKIFQKKEKTPVTIFFFFIQCFKPPQWEILSFESCLNCNCFRDILSFYMQCSTIIMHFTTVFVVLHFYSICHQSMLFFLLNFSLVCKLEYCFSKRHLVDFSKLKEFADDNFRYDENGRKILLEIEQ